MAGSNGVLDKKTRVRLVLAVVDELRSDDLSLPDMNVILETYGLEPYSTNSSLPSLHEIVTAATDEQLVDLAEYFNLEVPDAAVPANRVATVGGTQPLFLFASHLTAHKVLVGAIKEHLLRYGIDLFVAHDTIEHDAL
jgi:hypothetical protein